MTQEYFDIFDKDNLPTGEIKTREEVHREKKDYHRVVDVWIVNRQGQFLCQQRSWKKDAHPGAWMSHFGGHVKAGQTYEECLRDELYEELGIRIISETNELVFVGSRSGTKGMHHTNVYVLHWNGAISDLAFNDGEVEQVAWMDFVTLKSEIDSGGFCNALSGHVLKYLKGQE